MEFWKSLAGMLTVEITSAVPEKTLDAITLAKIQLSHVVQKDELIYQFQIRRKDYRKLCEILRRRGESQMIVRKRGIYWSVKSACRRPFLLTVFLLLLVSAWYLPSRIYFVTVEGNTTIPDRLILSAAEGCGIRFAASRKLVRSEKVKNELLSAVPQLQWAGVNTSGCTAVISVRERTETEEASEEKLVSNLIADRDGYILSATITSGTAQVLPGETVTKGQVLISGYTDCGICIRASRAEGEITAQTNRTLNAIMLEKYMIPQPVAETKYRISLIIGKKRINLWKDSRISDVCCGRMYEEYFVPLPGGFQLPVGICIDQYLVYEIQEARVLEAEAQRLLEQFSENYLHRQMIAGQILRKQQKLSGSDGLYMLEGSYTCTEVIGKEQREQIGVINGKRD